MECYTIRNLTFTYPGQIGPVLKSLNISIQAGQFVVLCGPSGCGKSTLLRHLKPVLSPHGKLCGEILFEGISLSDVDRRTQSAKIGFVQQSPDNQIVTDKVWHELAFGLESLGFDTPSIRLRVAEMASFFGIETWFYKNVTELSGGQKQLLNLASIMAMQPSVLILDEPSSQLDPIAAAEFLGAVGRINRELGVTVIITEHRLEEVFPHSDRVLVMDDGRFICEGTAQQVGQTLKERKHGMFLAMPVPMKIYSAVQSNLTCPVTVREGRTWLDSFAKENPLGDIGISRMQLSDRTCIPAVELKEVWFRYKKDTPDVVRGLSMKVFPGEFYAVLGGNGTGKTTALSLIFGINRPYRGNVSIYGKELSDIDSGQLFNQMLGVLPQNPQAVFVKKTVKEDLLEMLSCNKLSSEVKNKKLCTVSKLCRLDGLLSMHPYDLSGGEQQRAALAKVLLLEPRILLLDEPTKGMDGEFKHEFAAILADLLKKGVTIVMVSHDIEFCAQYSHRCALFFDGNIISVEAPNRFFSGNSFYTTAANRMARHRLPNAVTAEEVIIACGGNAKPYKIKTLQKRDIPISPGIWEQNEFKEKNENKSVWKESSIKSAARHKVIKRHLSKRTLAAVVIILLVIPLTIYIGIYYLGDRKYYFISMLIILETMLPFVMVFESRKPQARELIVIAVLCAIGVAGRAAFFMLPQFKPVVAVVIIAGVAFGGESGFLVGAVTGFVSNMFFGQGPWTPWQMFAFGIVGFLAGVLFQKGILRRNTAALCIFGGLATFIIYGGIMNPAAVLMFQSHPTIEMFYFAYLQGIPFDLVHAIATVVFLWLIAKPVLEKLDRIKVKYGLMEHCKNSKFKQFINEFSEQ